MSFLSAGFLDSEIRGSSSSIWSISLSMSVLTNHLLTHVHDKRLCLLRCQVEEVNWFGLNLSVFAHVLEDDAGRVVSEEKSF